MILRPQQVADVITSYPASLIICYCLFLVRFVQMLAHEVAKRIQALYPIYSSLRVYPA